MHVYNSNLINTFLMLIIYTPHFGHLYLGNFWCAGHDHFNALSHNDCLCIHVFIYEFNHLSNVEIYLITNCNADFPFRFS